MTYQSHPWNRALAQGLSRDTSRISHALLLAGVRGLGKNDFALWLAQLLLCRKATPSGIACGTCQSCMLFSAGTHPDLHVIQTESACRTSESLLSKYALRYLPEKKTKDSKDSTAIRIDQVRDLIESTQTRPQISGCRVLILSQADAMNTNASNSLLKLLEEPPPDSYLLLVADRPAQLPATIRSRCNRIDFRIPDQNEAKIWLAGQGVVGSNTDLLLALGGGAPREALRLAELGFPGQRDQLIADLADVETGQGDPLAAATRWRQIGADRCLAWLQGWLHDLIRLRLDPAAKPTHNPDRCDRLQAQEKRLDLNHLLQFAGFVAQNRHRLGGSLDEQLLMEDTLIRWGDLQKIADS